MVQPLEPGVGVRAAAPRDGRAGGGAWRLGLPAGRHGRRLRGHRQGRPRRRGGRLHQPGGRDSVGLTDRLMNDL
jgi:hypothetical protein